MRFRVLAILFTFTMAVSFLIPWLVVPVELGFLPISGTISPLMLAKEVDWSSSDLNRFKDLIDLVTSSRPELTGFVWAATALAISFPLAALFLLIGLLGYYGKLMGIVLGGIPVGILSYLVYVLSQLSDLNGVPLDLESVINALSEALQQTSAYGIPIYAGAGMSLFLLSLLDPGRKP